MHEVSFSSSHLQALRSFRDCQGYLSDLRVRQWYFALLVHEEQRRQSPLSRPVKILLEVAERLLKVLALCQQKQRLDCPPRSQT